MKFSSTILFATVGLAVLAPPAWAAAAPGPPPARDTATADGLLGEVVVTATRQSDTVSRVPLSITAITQRSMDQQGIRNVSDLARTVPALTVSGTIGGVQNFAIRGISSTQGAATTGVYLDDTPLTKRNTPGVSQNNGTPAPPLFDLERVEVLRGPQGTLYGGSSQGGTVRFITPQPSLTRYSGQARAEFSSTENGSPSYEGGVAVGGPLVQDKLGFRASIFSRHTGGYIDIIDPYNNGALKIKDSNFSDTWSGRAVLAWAPSAQSRVTLSYYQSRISVKDQNNAYYLPLSGTYTTVQRCYDTTRTFTASSGASALVTCPTGAVPSNIFVRRPITYGPFDYIKEFQSIAPGQDPAITKSQVASMTLDYNFEHMTVKSVTSYIHDMTSAATSNTNQLSGVQSVTQNGSATPIATATGFPLFAPFQDYAARFVPTASRYGIIEELRFASSGDPQPFSWVGGIYYSNIRGESFYYQTQDLDRVSQVMFGVNTLQRYGVPLIQPGNIVTQRMQHVADNEIAAFGEVNYYPIEKLKVTGGLRMSRVGFNFDQLFFGPVNGFIVPTAANTGVAAGSTTESPVTPKVGLQYQFDGTRMVYASAAKGYRAGGVNSPLSPGACGLGLANVGLTVNDVPVTFGSDSVWSYEAGAKVRLLNRIQLNSSVYRIDWSKVQLNVQVPGCGQTWVQNAGSARSQGAELEGQARVFRGFTVNLAASYNQAKYTTSSFGPKPISGAAPSPIVLAGDTFPVSPWTVSLGAQYDTSIGGRSVYARADYRYASSYKTSTGPGTNAFTPDTYIRPASDVVNARIGMSLGVWDLNAFVNNLFDSRDRLATSGGRTGCSTAQLDACTTYTSYTPFTTVTTFRPREIGVQLAYRH